LDWCAQSGFVEDAMNRSIGEIGYWSGLGACGFTVSYDVVQILQVAGLTHFPLDEILIYGTSLCIVVPFILEMLSFHHLAEGDKKFWTHASLVFTIVYAVFVSANYVVQLATVIPSKLRGASETISILDQTPHSLFWNYDALGYIAMGIATLLAVPAVKNSGFERWVRMSLIANALATPLIGFVYFYPTFSPTLFLIGFPWGITAPLFMALLANLLRRKQAAPARS
jgi:heme/copper-type cytochrome/quinol oxidase subunit 4